MITAETEETGDREIDTISLVVKLLEQITPDARRRSVKYLDARYGSVPAPRGGF